MVIELSVLDLSLAALLILALAVRPTGVFGKAVIRKV